MKDKILGIVKNYSSINLFTLAVSLLLTTPIMSLVYWVFDASYLASFGIGPEIYSRPAFSSDFINFWVYALSFQPVWWGWSFLSIVIFVVLMFANYIPNNSCHNENKEESKKKSRWYDPLSKAISKAYLPSVTFFISGLIALMLISVATLKTIDKGRELAKEQINSFIEDGNCIDSFDNRIVGCYRISDEASDDDILVIVNDEKTLAYMKKKMDTAANTSSEVSVVLKDKKSGQTISREYRVAEPEAPISLDKK